MLAITWAIVLAALQQPAPPTADSPLIQLGEKVVLRVRQLIPCDGLSPGERLLNSRPQLVPGDHFVAEILHGAHPSGVLIDGAITRIQPPGRFRRPGYVEIQLLQLVEFREGMTAPTALRVDLLDRRIRAQALRGLANFYAGFEGGDVGASIGAQLAQGNLGFVLGGAGIGCLVGLGTTAFVRGPDGSLEPGDTFEISVGSCSSYRPLPNTSPMTIYPPKVPVRK